MEVLPYVQAGDERLPQKQADQPCNPALWVKKCCAAGRMETPTCDPDTKDMRYIVYHKPHFVMNIKSEPTPYLLYIQNTFKSSEENF